MTTTLLELDGFRAASSLRRYAHSSRRKNQNDNVFRLIRLERQDGRLGGLSFQGGCQYFSKRYYRRLCRARRSEYLRAHIDWQSDQSQRASHTTVPWPPSKGRGCKIRPALTLHWCWRKFRTAMTAS